MSDVSTTDPQPPAQTSQASSIVTILQNIVQAINGLSSAFRGGPTTVALIAVGTPSNANAAAAGVAVGQQYRDTNDPSRVFVRSV